MAAQLWFLRHGEAEEHRAGADAQRRLTERGERQALAAGRALACLSVVFQAVFTSPRVRARDTARLAAEGLGATPVVHAPLSGGFDVGQARALALEAPGDGDRVLLVGHEPDFTQIVSDLTGARIELKKGGVAAVRLREPRGELIVLLRPRELDPLSQTDDGADR